MKEDGGTRQAVEAHQPGDDLRCKKGTAQRGKLDDGWARNSQGNGGDMCGIWALTCSLDLRDACAADGLTD